MVFSRPIDRRADQKFYSLLLLVLIIRLLKTVGCYKREGQRPPFRMALGRRREQLRRVSVKKVHLMAFFSHENREIHGTVGKYIYNPRPVVVHRT